MNHNLHKYIHHLTSLTLEGLSPEAKADIEKYINDRKVDETGGGAWGFFKWAGIIALIIGILLCLFYFLYQWCKSKTETFQANPMMPGAGGYGGYGGYQQNYPVMAGAGGIQGIGYGGGNGMPGGFGGMGAPGGKGYQ